MLAIASLASAAAFHTVVPTAHTAKSSAIHLVCSASENSGPPCTGATRRKAMFAAVTFGLGHLSGAHAYDSIPAVETDFGAAEKARKEREIMGQANLVKIQPYLKKLSDAKTGKDFEAAADELSVFIIGCPRADPKGTSSRKECLDGIPIKEIVGRIREDYDTLPLFYYKCPKGQERRDGSLCRSPGLSVEDAFNSLIKELRKGTVIQTGDFRRVELFQF